MSSTEDPNINAVIAGKYRIEQRVARGGMGSIYLATHEMMNRKVALKLLHDNLREHEDSEVFFKRFLREARAASQLEHPNAVMIYDFGVVDEVPYLAMQYIDGRTLSSLLSQEGRFPFKRALPLFEQICSALDAAHCLTIAHRDIKPDNIMIQKHADGSETAHVLDFGIAKAMQGSSTMVGAMTTAGKTVGTPRYMSPEQALGKEIDPRTDVYSLGIVFYEMLSGDIPYSADSPIELMYEHLRSEPRALPADLGLPAGVQQAINKALAKEPKDRFSTPMEFVAALKEAIKNPTPLAEPTSLGASLKSIATPLLATAKKHSQKLLLGVGILLLAVIAFRLLANRSSEQTQVISESTSKEESGATHSAQVTTTAPTTEETEQLPSELASTTKEEEKKEVREEIREVESPASTPAETTSSAPTDVEDQVVLAEEESPTEQVVEDEAIESETGLSETTENEGPVALNEEVEAQPAKAKKKESKTSKAKRAAAEMSVQELVDALGAEQRALRIESAIELQSRGDEAIEALIIALSDNPSARVRYLSAFILGKMKAKQALPALREAENDSAGMVAETARRAVQSISR